jgi:hypothetical protein
MEAEARFGVKDHDKLRACSNFPRDDSFSWKIARHPPDSTPSSSTD